MYIYIYIYIYIRALSLSVKAFRWITEEVHVTFSWLSKVIFLLTSRTGMLHGGIEAHNLSTCKFITMILS